MTTASDNTAGGSAADIHRLLDEVFTGVEMTAERQDLKEEIRGNLSARVADLETAGMAPGAAARRAIEELGDVRAVLDMSPAPPDASNPAGASWAGGAAVAAAWASRRVRPDPAFVVRTVVLSVVAATGLALPVLGATVARIAPGLQIAAVLVVALALGTVTADALRQETTLHYPMPTRRAVGFGAAAALGLAGLGAGWRYLCGPDLHGIDLDGAGLGGAGLPWLVVGVLLLLTGVVVATYLGATQTNRYKEWVLRLNDPAAAAAAMGDRFGTDPAAAARFGLYTVTIWLVAFAAFVALVLTAGWAWSWLALVGGMVVMMLTLARMQFGQRP